MARVECNIGGPAQLDIVGARRGSRWYLPWVLTLTADEGDGSTVTGAMLALKPLNAGDDVDPVLEVEATIESATEDAVVGYFEVDLDSTPDVAAGAYEWDWELVATDPKLNGWAPTAGTWRVPGRVVVRTEGS